MWYHMTSSLCEVCIPCTAAAETNGEEELMKREKDRDRASSETSKQRSKRWAERCKVIDKLHLGGGWGD